jgi:outer membrane protein TolC
MSKMISRELTALLLAFAVIMMLPTDTVVCQTLGHITLTEALQKARVYSPQMRQNLLNLDVAEAKARSARDWWVPDVGAGVQMHQQNGAAMNSDGRFFLDINRQYFAAGGTVDVTLDLKDAFLGTRAAELAYRAQQQTNIQNSNEFLGFITMQYYALQATQLKLEALGDFVLYSDRIAKELEAFANAGLALRSDYIAAQANHKKYQVRERQFAREQLYISEQLKLMLGMAMDSVMLTVDTTALLTDARSIAVVIDTAVLNHPLYRSELLKSESLEKEQKAAAIGLALPTLDANFAFGQFGDIFSATDINDNPINALHPTTAFYGTLGWKIPLENIFGGGNNGVLKAQFKLQEQEAAIRKDELSTAIRKAQHGVKQTREAYVFAEEAVTFARSAYEQSLARQQNGIASAYELFQAQEEYLNATLSWIQMRYELSVAIVALRVGRGDVF